MDEQKISAVPGVIAAIEAFWGEPTKPGRVKTIITRCAPDRDEAGAVPFIDHEREEFDQLGRLVERLRYDDDGNLYRRERIVYPPIEAAVDSAAGRYIRFMVELIEDGRFFEWRYLPEGPLIWASCFEADGNEVDIWGYRLDPAGRIVECAQEDGRGRFLGRHRASYDGSGRPVELVSLDADGPELLHRFEYGQDYRKIFWDGGPAGTVMLLERFDEVDGNGNWLRMTESTYRDGVEVGDAMRYERETEY